MSIKFGGALHVTDEDDNVVELLEMYSYVNPEWIVAPSHQDAQTVYNLWKKFLVLQKKTI